MVTATIGHCSRCGKVWTLETRQGVCRWCEKQANCQTSQAKPRQVKSSRRRRQRQADGNGYDQLDGNWLTYYKVASKFTHKAQAQDREDLLHDIMIALDIAERNNGNKPFTQAAMYRIASRRVADYWRAYYKANNGLDCSSCNKAQRQKCREDWVYPDCPKAITLESLNKPIIDSDGNLTELGELIADDKAIDLDGWVSETIWELGYKPRQVALAYKLKAGIPLDHKEREYLRRLRLKDQKRLF